MVKSHKLSITNIIDISKNNITNVFNKYLTRTVDWVKTGNRTDIPGKIRIVWKIASRRI